jgi:hypothetical protein
MPAKNDTRLRKLLFAGAAATFLGLVASHFAISPSSTYDKAPGRLAAIGEPIPHESFPSFLNRPRTFETRTDGTLLITRESVIAAAGKSLPTFRPPTVSLLLHELRLWGTGTTFTRNNGCRHKHSSEILKLLTDEDMLVAGTFAVSESEFMTETPFGIRVSVQGKDSGPESRGESHYGQYAAAFGTAKISSNTQIFKRGELKFTLRQHLNDLALGYRPQFEQEFFAVAMAHYLNQPFTWQDESGSVNDLNFLVSTLYTIELGKGSCFGTHVPYAVAAILQAE